MSAYLVVRANCRYRSFCGFVTANAGVGTLVAARGIHEVTTLEPGSRPLHTWISRFEDLELAKSAWSELRQRELLGEAGEEPLVLAAHAVPDDGYPEAMSFVPTRHNVESGPVQPPTLLLIEGTGTDQDRMDRYRDILLPLMREQRSYYLCFELGGDVAVLSGTWDEAIFAISRWPGAERPLALWLGDRYQEEAIPLRLGIGRFEVVALEAERDE